MHSEDFDNETAHQAAQALEKVLASRRHRKTVLGQPVMVPGQLGFALKLPQMIRGLESRSHSRRQDALERFQALWETLSDSSREQVREALGWYDPRELDWDDRRSNRRPEPGSSDSS